MIAGALITEIRVQAFLTGEECDWLDAEVKRMDREESITGRWSRETVLESMLQIAIDRARGVDESTEVKSLKERLRKLEKDSREMFGGAGREIEADLFWDDVNNMWMVILEEVGEDRRPNYEEIEVIDSVKDDDSDPLSKFSKTDTTLVIVRVKEIDGTKYAEFVRASSRGVVKKIADATPADVEALAKAFARRMANYCGREEMESIVRRNERDADKRICHSHDFCDANQVMIDSLGEQGYSFEEAMNEETHFVDRAWAMARENNFYMHGGW